MRSDAIRHRELLIDAASRVFAARGYDVPLSEVLRDANLGRGTLYRHFSGREALIIAVLDREVRDLRDELQFQLDDPALFTDFLVRQSVSACAYLPLLDSLAKAPTEQFLNEIVPLYDAIVADVIGAAKRHGTVRDDMTVEDFHLAVRMLSATRQSRKFSRLPENGAARSLDLVMKGIGPHCGAEVS